MNKSLISLYNACLSKNTYIGMTIDCRITNRLIIIKNCRQDLRKHDRKYHFRSSYVPNMDKRICCLMMACYRRRNIYGCIPNFHLHVHVYCKKCCDTH